MRSPPDDPPGVTTGGCLNHPFGPVDEQPHGFELVQRNRLVHIGAGQ